MAAKGSRERVKTLLKDTITLLCKNGLEFKKKFNVEALIGVTLDDDEVMLISLNEVVKADKASSDVSDNETENSLTPDTTTKTKTHRRRKRPTSSDATPIKEEPGSPLYDVNTATQEGFSAKAEDLWGDGDPPTLTPSVLEDLGTESTSADEPASKRRQLEDDQSASRGAQSDEGDGEEDEDLVFVKEEMSESMLASCSMEQSQVPQSFQQSQFTGSAFSAEISQDGSMLWSQSSQRAPQRRNFSPRTHASTSSGIAAEEVEHLQQFQNQSIQLDPQQSQANNRTFLHKCSFCSDLFTTHQEKKAHEVIHGPPKKKYQCPTCFKGFSSTTGLRGHMSWHTGIIEFKCEYCHKQYRFKDMLRKHVENVHANMIDRKT